MRGVKAACGELVDALRAAGLRADVDPDLLALDPGCVWVQPRQIGGYTLAGGGTLVVWLYLIVADVETSQALALLDDTLEAVLELDGITVSDTDDVIDLSSAVILPSNPLNPLPAYRLAVDLDL